MYLKLGDEGLVRQRYDEIGLLANRLLGIYFPKPASLEIVPGPNLWAESTGAVRRLGPSRIYFSEGDHFLLDLSIAHAGAHAYQHAENPRIPIFIQSRNEFLSRIGLLSEGWARRVEELLAKELTGFTSRFFYYLLKNQFEWLLNPGYSGVQRGMRIYNEGKQIFEKIGRRAGWDAEIEAARYCASDVELMEFLRECEAGNTHVVSVGYRAGIKTTNNDQQEEEEAEVSPSLTPLPLEDLLAIYDVRRNEIKGIIPK